MPGESSARVRAMALVFVTFFALLTGACATPSKDTAGSPFLSTLAEPSGPGDTVAPAGTLAVAAADPVTGKRFWGVPITDTFGVFSGMALDRRTLYGQWAGCAGGQAGAVAIDVRSGKVRWRSPSLYGGETLPVSTSLTGGVFVTMSQSNAVDKPSALFGFDTATGAVRWHKELALATGLATLDQAVVAVAVRTAPGSTKAGGSIEGFDRATGKLLWTSPPAKNDAGVIALANDDRHVFATFYEPANAQARAAGHPDTTATVAFEARTGKRLWEFPGADPRPGAPRDRTVVLVGEPSTTVRSSPATSLPPTDAPPSLPPGVVPAPAVVPVGQAGEMRSPPVQQLVGVDTDTGKVRWTRQDVRILGARDDVADGRVVLGKSFNAQERGVVVVEIATGKNLWASSDTDVVVNRPHGIVLTNLSAGKTTLYDPATGRVIGTPPQLAMENNQVTIPPQIGHDHHVYLARGCPGRG